MKMLSLGGNDGSKEVQSKKKKRDVVKEFMDQPIVESVDTDALRTSILK